MASPYSWHPPAPSSALQRFEPETAARLTDLGQACNALAMSIAGITAASECAQMRLSHITGDRDEPSQTPQLLRAEDVTCRALLLAAATLTAHFTEMAVAFAAQASAAVIQLARPDSTGEAPATPRPSDFLRKPAEILPPVSEFVSHLEPIDRDALDDAYQRMIESAWRCRGDGFEQFDDPSTAEPGLTTALAVTAHAYAVLLVHAGRIVSA